tara:strand:+ start:19 stop:687 length:669 start_codon:yes stop_codon:yes gene_type:complete
MKNKKTKLLILFFFIFLTTYKPSGNKIINNKFFPITNFIIENNYLIEENSIIKKLNILKGKNLTFINEEDIEKIFKNFSLIASAQIKKIYPNTLKIIIIEKKLVAVLIKEKNKFYISEEGNLIEYTPFEFYKNLPIVFGSDKNFSKLYEKLLKVKFDLKNIKAYYYFEIGRWDIELTNNKIIKLPIEDYDKSLINFMQKINQKNFNDYKVFDYRIKNQVILK